MGSIFYGWWVVLACSIFTFYVCGTAIFGFTAFFEPIANEFGWSYTQISLAASLRGLELGIFAPIMGFFVDRFGARRLLIFATLLIGSGFIVLSRVQTLGMYYFGFVLLGLGTSASTGTVLTSAVANWFKKDVGKALGIMISGVGAGGLLLPLITFLIDHYHWRTTFLIQGIGMFIIGFPLASLVRHTPEKYGYLPDGDKSSKERAAAGGSETELGVKAALGTRVFWHLCIAESIRLMVLATLITHVIPYLSSLGVPRTQATFVATSIPVISIAGRLFFGWLADKFNKFHVLAVLYFLGGISIFIFAHAETTWLIYPFLILFPLSWGAPPLRGAILREHFGRLAFGSILGVLSGIGTLIRIAGPALAGWAYDSFGSYHLIWLCFTGAFGVGILLMLSLSPPKWLPGKT